MVELQKNPQITFKLCLCESFSIYNTNKGCLTFSLTSNNELTLVFDDSGIVLGDAGVGAVVHPLEVGDTHGAGEVDVVDGNTQAGINGLSIFLPGDRDGKVT